MMVRKIREGPLKKSLKVFSSVVTYRTLFLEVLMYVLVCYVPVDYASQVKEALFSSGAGCGFGYEKCCFEVEGVGQFLPTDSSHPFIGKRGALESVKEMRIEMTLSDDILSQVVDALKRAHPYEVPAYHLIKVETIE
jgi:hypothetical protein